MDGSPVSESDAELRDAVDKTDADAKSPVSDPAATEETAKMPAVDLDERTIGDFHLLRRLGKGGMAEVYLAEQISLKRQVALKVLRRDLVDESDDVMLRRFEQEATAAAGLTHPNIVQVFSIGEEAGIHYIAQEYVQGSNLREFIRRKGSPELAVSLHIMRQVAAALQASGEAGIVHRDIKPENILITRKGDVKVADFGLAQLTQAGDRVNLTQVGITMGTPLYMSPEQVNGRKLDARSDLYSFGVTCWHMLAGRPPYRGETALSVAVMHLNEKVPPLEKERPDLPRGLCDLVKTMMAKEPGKRPENAAAVVESLDRITRSTRAGARFADGEFDVSVTQHRLTLMMRMLRHPTALKIAMFVAACLVVGAISAGVGVWTRPGNPLDAPLPEETARSKVERLDTADRQVSRAIMSKDDEEAAWQAVIDYFPGPEARLQRQRAREKLGILYLGEQRFGEAETIYRGFVAQGDRDPETKAHGLAGLAVIACLKGEFDEAQRLIRDELLPVRDDLKHPEMVRLYLSALGRVRDHFEKKDGDKFNALFGSEFESEPSGGP